MITVFGSGLIILDSSAFSQKELMKPFRNQINSNFAKGCKEGTCTLKHRSAFKCQRSHNLCHDHTSLLKLLCTYSAVVDFL